MCADRYSVLLQGGGKHLPIYHTCAGCQVGTGLSFNRGGNRARRPDQNTNARKLSERKGSSGMVRSDMKKDELTARSAVQVRKLKDARQQGSQGRSECSAAHFKKRRAEEPNT